MFVGKARSVFKSVAPEKGFTQVSSCLTHNHYTNLEKLAKDKHSSLFQTFVKYGRKKFYKIGPWGLYYKTFYGGNLRIFVIS